MLAAAILVVGVPPLPPQGREAPAAGATNPPEMLANELIAHLEILGRSAVQRTILRLQNQGLKVISLVAEDTRPEWILGVPTQDLQISLVHPPTNPWLAADRKLKEYVAAGVENILLMRLGAYADIEFAELLRFHREKGQPVTRGFDGQGPLDLWLMDSARAGRCGMTLNGPDDVRSTFPLSGYRFTTYVNRLRDARDVRRLAMDALLSRCSITPAGRESKPGIWLDDEAHVHRTARLVAPAYIGKDATVRAAALVTRCSNLERGCEVDYGTVVEDVSLLANSYLGCCLDVSHAVIAGSQFVHLNRNVTLDIADGKLIGTAMSQTGWRSFIAQRQEWLRR